MKSPGRKKSIGDIAIIGMAGRFPGARDVETFWQNLKNGVESISFFSDEELIAAGVAPEVLADPNYIKARPMLDDVEAFDAEFFGYSPREAETMDPQHRIFLETAWAALEDAGYDSWRYPGAIGTYGGLYFDTYLLNNLCTDPQRISSLLNQSEPGSYNTYLGNDKDYLTSRVAYKMNLRGPAMTIQTACSSSLVAVCQACQSLLYYQCDIALAGGVTVIVPQKKGYLYQEGSMQSRDGHCRVFDADAQGTLFGSGVGIVALKRLDEALAEGDHIYAVIKGSAINNDGAVKVSYTAPSVDGQSEVIVLAQAIAGVSADTISYIEAHGTGTPLGDPIELAALTQAFQETTDKAGFCAIGSLKGNVGHLDAAAGVAGLIKTAIALEQELIPPTLHFTKPNPKIDFANSPFYVVSKPTVWKTQDEPRRAGVSAFGVGGTNAHVVLEEAPVTEASGPSRESHLLMLSAKTPAALQRSTAGLAEHLKAHPDINLADVAYTLHVGRRILPHRKIVVCRDAANAVVLLEKPDPKRVFTSHQRRTDSSVVFMFPGQGSQWVGMGSNLYSTELVFREAVDRCAEFLQPLLQVDLRTILFPEAGKEKDAEELLVQTRFTQPALFAIEYAMASLWMSWGVKPSAMIGHSVGEYVAACLAGVFSLEDGLRLIAERGRLVQEQPQGSMLAVGLPESEVAPLLEGLDQTSVAAINSPNMCVVAGPDEHVAKLEKILATREVFHRVLLTSHAFHSPMMESAVAPFAEAVRRVALHAPEIPYISNVTAQWIVDSDATDPQYWAAHIRKPVRFGEGIAQLIREPGTVLLEVGPGHALGALARQHPDWNSEQAVVASLVRGDESNSTMVACGQLWLAGRSLDTESFFANERRRRLSLPTYPFERQRHWVEPDRSAFSLTVAKSTAKSTPSTREADSLRETPPTPSSDTLPKRPLTRVEQLKVMLEELSGRDYSDTDANTSFVELGFESLFLTQVSLAISKRFGVRVAFRQLLGEIDTLALLAVHLDRAAGLVEASPIPTPVEMVAPLSAPLTEAQREVWLGNEIGEAGSCAFNQCSVLQLRGRLNRDVLDGAIQDLVTRHDGLRTTFGDSGELQNSAATLPIKAEFLDLSARPNALDGLLSEEASRPFDLANGPLVRVRIVRLSEEHHVVVFSVHHIVCDGRSLSLLLHDLGELYSAKAQGRAPNLPPARSLMAYAVAESARSESASHRAAEAYWLKQYSERPPTLDLPVDFSRPDQKTFRGKLATLELSPDVVRSLKHFGAQYGCTLFTTLLAAYYVLLYRLTGQQDVVVGVPFAAPNVEAGEPLVGHTVNFLALRSFPEGELAWGEYLQAVKQLVMDAYEHRDSTYGVLLQELKWARDFNRTPLLAVSFNLAQSRYPLQFADLQSESKPNPHAFTNLDLTFDFSQNGDDLSLECIYNADVFDAPTIERWLRHYQLLLEAATNSESVLGKLPLLSETDRLTQIVKWNNTAVAIPSAGAIHEWFESQVSKTPDARALTFENEHLTYDELNRRSNQLAGHLRGLGIGPDVFVGLMVERSLEMVIGLLGILKAGGAYIPLDPTFPQDRLEYMVENSGMRVLVTHGNLDERLRVAPEEIVHLDSTWAEIAKQDSSNLKSLDLNPDQLAYVLYTSGSTGRPKGVEIPHSAVVNFLFSMQREPGFTSKDSLLAVTTLSFDIAGLELYLPLVSGGAVAIASYEQTHDPARLMERMRSSGCTVMQATPTTWRALIDAGWSGSPTLKVLCGGEAMPRDLLVELLPRCRELWNMYGPTETTIWSTVHRVVSIDGAVLIGKPIANTQAFVLDPYGDLVPEGAIGELYIGGAGLARGYLGMPELTSQRFVENHFAQGEQLYRTGDLARWTSSGDLEGLGRIDGQVKVRGFRIEVGEIESLLALHEAVKQCVVVAREDTPGDQRLVAYIEPRTETMPSGSDLRAFLATKLPDYMLPSIFVPVDRMPTTPNGKIDRKALPAPSGQHIAGEDEFLAPRDLLEQSIANVWAKSLKAKRVGLRDNFFELGGHSLIAVRMLNEVEKLTGRNLPLATLLQASTVETFAELLRKKQWTPSWSSLVPLRASGSKPALFLMHAHGGNVLEYHTLANLMDPDQPVYAFQSRGLDGSFSKGLTFEQMAASYVEELRSFQPEGPYYLGGFCLGGMLALEAAQQLKAAGQEVAVVMKIQSMHPAASEFRPDMSKFSRFRSKLAQRIALERENLSHAGKGYIWERIQRTWDMIHARVALARDESDGSKAANRSQLPKLYVFQAISKEQRTAFNNYVPRSYDGDVVVLRASKQLSGIQADEYLGWKELFTGRVELHEIRGQQQNLLLEPNVRGLANVLSASLNAAQQRHATKGQEHRQHNDQRNNAGRLSSQVDDPSTATVGVAD